MAIARTERVGDGVEGYAGPAEVTPGHPVPGRRRARGKFSFGWMADISGPAGLIEIVETLFRVGVYLGPDFA
jgi:hypothetical protein